MRHHRHPTASGILKTSKMTLTTHCLSFVEIYQCRQQNYCAQRLTLEPLGKYSLTWDFQFPKSTNTFNLFYLRLFGLVFTFDDGVCSSTYISRVFIKTEMVLKSRSVLSGSKQLVRSRSSDNLPTSQSQVNIQMMSHTLTIREVSIAICWVFFCISFLRRKKYRDFLTRNVIRL